jgi:hypothetical protein
LILGGKKSIGTSSKKLRKPKKFSNGMVCVGSHFILSLLPLPSSPTLEVATQKLESSN